MPTDVKLHSILMEAREAGPKPPCSNRRQPRLGKFSVRRTLILLGFGSPRTGRPVYALRKRGLRRADFEAILGLLFRIVCVRVDSVLLVGGAAIGLGWTTGARRTSGAGLRIVGLGTCCRRGRSGFSSDSS